MIAKPTLTSAAATTIIKKTNNCASVPAVTAALLRPSVICILENATSNKLTELSISSIHIKIIIALRRVKTPVTPMQNKHAANAI